MRNDAFDVKRTRIKKGRKELLGPYSPVWANFASLYSSHFSESKYLSQFADLKI